MRLHLPYTFVIRQSIGNKMARPTKDQTMETVSVRLPRAMVEEIDRFVKALKGDMPLLNISRADGVRQLLANALADRAAAGRKKATRKR